MDLHTTTLDIDLIAVETAATVAVLLQVTAPAVDAIVIRPADCVPAFTLWNDVQVMGLEDGLMAALDGPSADVLLEFEVPGLADLGAVTIAQLELRWVDPATQTARAATVPVNVNAHRSATA